MPAVLTKFAKKVFNPFDMVPAERHLGEFPSAKDAYKSALKISYPSILEQLLVATIGLMDTFMVSSLGEATVSAVGLTDQPKFVVLCLMMSLNMGVTAVTARRRGENDADGANRALKQSLMLNLIFSIVISLACFILAEPFLSFAGANSNTLADATDYFRILLCGIPIYSLSLTICAAQRGIGNTRVSMQVNMTANIVNVILNYLLIGGNFGFPALGVKGAAIATISGFAVSFILAIASLIYHPKFLKISFKSSWKFDKETLKSLYIVTSGSFVEQICMRIGFFLYAKLCASLGTVAHATHVYCMHICNLGFSIANGLSIASSSLVGQNLGAKRPDLSLAYGKICQRIGFITSCIIFFLLNIFGVQMLGLFTHDQTVINTGIPILRLVSFIMFGQSAQMVFLGSLRGAGDTRFTAILSLISVTCIRVTTAYFFAYVLNWGIFGAWVGFLFDQYVRCFATLWRFASGKWEKIKL